MNTSDEYAAHVAEGAHILADIIDQRGLLLMWLVIEGRLPPMVACVHHFWEAEQLRRLRGEHYWEIIGA